jgi:hypothetical protein
MTGRSPHQNPKSLKSDGPVTLARDGPELWKDCFSLRAGDGDRTRITSLEGWDSAIELRPRG